MFESCPLSADVKECIKKPSGNLSEGFFYLGILVLAGPILLGILQN